MCPPQRNHCSGGLLPGNTAYRVGGYLGIQTARVTLVIRKYMVKSMVTHDTKCPSETKCH